MVRSNAHRSRADRVLGIAFGLLTQVLFAATVWRLFWFLWGGRPATLHARLWVDAALSLQFALPHSLLLLPRVRRASERWIRPEFYGLLYCSATCATLLLTFTLWQTSAAALWRLDGTAAVITRAGFFASWAALFYSLHLTGLGYQTGLTPWLYWLRGRQLPRRDFHPRGAYRWFRHPVYLSFLGLIWFTPTMTLDHAVLTGLWTVYIFTGSYLKDERLAFYLGQTYREYQIKVTGCPLVGFGPWGRRARPFVLKVDEARTAGSRSGRGRAA